MTNPKNFDSLITRSRSIWCHNDSLGRLHISLISIVIVHTIYLPGSVLYTFSRFVACCRILTTLSGHCLFSDTLHDNGMLIIELLGSPRTRLQVGWHCHCSGRKMKLLYEIPLS